MKHYLIPVFLVCLGLISSVLAAPPNIIYILADDLGYGDVKCLNPERGKIATPSMNQLAAQGMIFTDAHTSSSVCTSSRYGILSGRYIWCTHLQSEMIWGYSPPLIAKDLMTLAGDRSEGGRTHSVSESGQTVFCLCASDFAAHADCSN